MNRRICNKILGLRQLIGNTPLLEINYCYRGRPGKIFAKAEYLNLTGSIKDRMALHIIESAYQSGVLKEGDTIVEATSGNTGIAFSAIGASLGHPVKIFMPDWMSAERIALIKSFGAEIVLVSKEQGGFLGSIAMTEDFKHKCDSVFLPQQFDNPCNPAAHYQSTGPEIWHQMTKLAVAPDVFVAGVGTGGTVMGTGRYLRKQQAGINIHPLEPSNSPTMSTGHKVGKHRIQGISDEFVPDIVNFDELDDIIAVDDGDAIIMAQQLSRKLGLGVGISSGANFLGAVMLAERYGFDANIVTIFCDDSKKYLSTDLIGEEPVKEGFISTDIALTGVVCHGRAFSVASDYCVFK